MTRVRFLWLFAAAVLAGASYMLARPLGIEGVWQVTWKGAGVSLLAIWAVGNARSPDGWLIAIVLALGAIGDMLLDAMGLVEGAIAFLLGHLVAATLYLRNRRLRMSFSQVGAAIALLVAGPVIAWLLPADRAAATGVAVYATSVALMAACAWVSRFSRYRVGLGVVMFLTSDLLIFAEMGPLHSSIIPPLTVWPLYFAGQALIAWGVVTRLAEPYAASRVERA